MACNTKAAYSGAVAALGFVCFAVGAAAVGLPLWGYFENPDAGYRPDERGYFGPWQTCKQMLYNRETCGPGVSRFRPVPAVWYAGLAAAGGVALLGAFCALSVLQLAMSVARERVLLPYTGVVSAKLALGLLAALLAAASAGLFALQTDREDRYRVSRGEAFYLQVTLIVLDFALFVLALYDLLFARRPGGDPTQPDGGDGHHHDAADAAASFGNPGFRALPAPLQPQEAAERGGGAARRRRRHTEPGLQRPLPAAREERQRQESAHPNPQHGGVVLRETVVYGTVTLSRAQIDTPSA